MLDATAPSPRVAILIVHYRTPEYLARCLDTIAAARVGVPHELLIVDNAPLDDRAAQLAALHGARYLPSAENLGYARGVNLGLAAARGEYALILNPDIEVRPGSIEALVDFMDAHPEAGLCGPRLYSPDGSLQYSARRNYTFKVILLRRTPLGRLWPRARCVREHLMMDWDHRDARDVDWMLGGAVLVRRTAVEDVGAMDTRYFLYFEDVDWCERMRGRGWRVVYVPQAEMVHAHRRSSARGLLGRSQRQHIESALRFYEKWSMLLYLWKQHGTRVRALATLLLDLVLLSAAFLGAYFTRYLLGTLLPGWAEARPVLALGVYSRFMLFADAIALTMFSFLGLYRGEVWRDRWREAGQLVKGVAITSLVVLATTFLFTRRPLSRFTILLFFPYALILVGLGRALLRRLVAGARERRLYLRRLAVLGPAAKLRETRERFARHGTFGYEPVFLAHEDERLHARAPGSDPVERRVAMLARERIAEVVIFDSLEDRTLLQGLLPRLVRAGRPVRIVPVGEEALRGGRRVEDFMGYTTVAFAGRQRRVGGPLKRGADIVLAAGLLILGAPLHLWQRLAIRGPLARSCEVVGWRGEEGVLHRYRALAPGLRRCSWLELYPALADVLRGRASFVGLTPLTPEQWAAVGDVHRAYPPRAPIGLVDARGRVWSGGAGGGFPSEGPAAGAAAARAPADPQELERILECGRGYVERWSLSEDLRIAAEAIAAILSRGGSRT